ncbi:MAG: hypothetical protein UIG52_06695 [Bacteroidales bacterium]|nr:hypothetical protein [Bacteroidales bacterium]
MMDYKHERPFVIIKRKEGDGFPCLKCSQDERFKLIAEMIDYGVWVYRIGCSCCDWLSHDICEDYGYIPDMSDKMVNDCFTSLREKENEVM